MNNIMEQVGQKLEICKSARHSMSTSGTTTSALAIGGENGGYRNLVEEWNGSAFSEITDINTTTRRRWGCWS
jgi:hypothetical protein